MNPFWIDENHMLQGPGVIHAWLPEAFTQAKITPRSVIMHSNASPTKVSGANLVAYMSRSDITIEAHLIPQMDGTIYQCVPFNRRADCNAQANGFAISMETQDNGSPTLEQTEWSPAQFETISCVLAALNVKYGIPLAATQRWDGAGVGFHSQFPQWSIYVGKTCPGRERIRQMPFLISHAQFIKDAPSTPEVPGGVHEENIVGLFRKDGKAAVWLADGKTRVHVDNMDKLGVLVGLYGPVTVLPATDNIEGIGRQVLSFTGDI